MQNTEQATRIEGYETTVSMKNETIASLESRFVTFDLTCSPFSHYTTGLLARKSKSVNFTHRYPI